jgi:hypothetical protein
MKKLFLGMAALAFLFSSCENDKNDSFNEQSKIDMSDFFVHTDANNGESTRTSEGYISCYSMTNLNRLLEEDPNLYKKMYDIEYKTRAFSSAKKPDGAGNGGGGNNGGGGSGGGDNLGVITIPVYVHVIYNNSNQNISDAQINSQIAVLNDDFARTNSDAGNTPSVFQDVAADTEIQFVLTAVTRKSSTRTSWGTNDAMKFASSGGVDAITPETHLNIWVCNIGGGILGYAQFPGGPSASDGVVVGPNFFGTQGYLSSPFDGGRTATHEVGHYLNLRHIWGDGGCNVDDFVNDTPLAGSPNYTGTPCVFPGPNTCSPKGRPGQPDDSDMFQNYMDYSDDACMNLFTLGQKERMRAVFLAGGPREAMAN